MESRLQTPFKDEAASAHSCDDEDKEDDGRNDMHRDSRNCDGPASRIAQALSLADKAGAFCLAIAVEDGQTEYIFETLSQTDLTSAQIRAKPNEPKDGKSFAQDKTA